ncbi:SH3 domain-binding protein 5-like isoform X1 [Carcharodon carcharias]|uniref:SH3 domain-binding protein 5-like isoform X1 n=1 Tax=Carcharodon carcharias TaxID=13397 RepID=UPI001B7E3358|nr:SH3 domain-binding protein 5-like isoform X1 [Carcharodon carcharias]
MTEPRAQRESPAGTGEPGAGVATAQGEGPGAGLRAGVGQEEQEEEEEEARERRRRQQQQREEEEELDPRIQEELEHLNQASEEINKLELQLNEARNTYRKILSESARKLNAQGSQLGNCIEKARPYYEARRQAKEAQQETQKAALRYERAVSMHNAAREMVYVAEQGLMADRNRLDPTWQEMLNHATSKVNEAEEERLRSEREHQRVTLMCQEAEGRVQELQKSLKRVIIKSKPYFELKAQFNQILEEHKAKVTSLEKQVSQAKTKYSVALRNLEQISEQIHARRLLRLGSRRASPVGAEAHPAYPEEEEEEEEEEEAVDKASARTPLGAEGPPSDTMSVLSFQTIASDLQKFDSVEHLEELSDALSLDSDDRDADRVRRPPSSFFKHHRSVSL